MGLDVLACMLCFVGVGLQVVCRTPAPTHTVTHTQLHTRTHAYMIKHTHTHTHAHTSYTFAHTCVFCARSSIPSTHVSSQYTTLPPLCRVRYLSSNDLSGTIPASLGSMDKLAHLYVRLCDVMRKQGIGSRVGDELRSAAQ